MEGSRRVTISLILLKVLWLQSSVRACHEAVERHLFGALAVCVRWRLLFGRSPGENDHQGESFLPWPRCCSQMSTPKGLFANEMDPRLFHAWGLWRRIYLQCCQKLQGHVLSDLVEVGYRVVCQNFLRGFCGGGASLQTWMRMVCRGLSCVEFAQSVASYFADRGVGRG